MQLITQQKTNVLNELDLFFFYFGFPYFIHDKNIGKFSKKPTYNLL